METKKKGNRIRGSGRRRADGKFGGSGGKRRRRKR